MSRRNEIKKDIWDIMRDVYKIPDFHPITDKQNEFLDRTIKYLESTISLRRKTDKSKQPEPEDNEPLARPEAAPIPDFSKTSLRRRGRKRDESENETTEVPADPDLDSSPKPIQTTTKTSTVATPPPKAPTKKSSEDVKKQKVKASININALPPHLRKYVMV